MQKIRQYLHSFSLRAHLAAALFVIASLGVVATMNTDWWPWSASADSLVEAQKATTKTTTGQSSAELPVKSCPVNEYKTFELVKPGCTISDNIVNIYQKSISLAFLVAFLVLVYAGYMYITSLGKPDQVKSAAELLTGVVAGIALLLLIPLLLDALGLTTNPESFTASGGRAEQANDATNDVPGWVPQETGNASEQGTTSLTPVPTYDINPNQLAT